MFRRVMSRAEISGWVDLWCFSYRKEMSPLLMGLFVRWCLAFWSISLGGIFVADWDESNAFCNLNRDDLPLLFTDTAGMGFGSWARSFFDSLQVFLQTPYGLADPYFLKQGGAQGDSMGVCQYLFVRLLRSKAFRQRVRGPSHPCIPTECVPEVVFSGDACLFAPTSGELGTNLNVAIRIAQHTGASVNRDKLAVFSLRLGSEGLIYAPAIVHCSLGELTCALRGLSVVGIPCVMGECVSQWLLNVESALATC